MKTHATLLLTLLTTVAQAGPRISAAYKVSTDTNDGGGQRSTSAAYTHDGSAGGITGISTVAVPSETARAGYLGQITEVTALQLTATPASVNETATRQLAAAQMHDDETLSALPATNITWSVASGPLSGIDTKGLATAQAVYQDTAATVQGDYAGASGTLELSVLDSIPDNFGSYADDGLDDDWQFGNFGLDNPDAAPLLDPDGDGQNNAFEFVAGLNPTNPFSRFLITIAPVPGQPAHKQIIFDPIVPGRNYMVKSSTDLSGFSWSILTGSTMDDEGDQRTVTDTAASETRKFYTVEIVKP